MFRVWVEDVGNIANQHRRRGMTLGWARKRWYSRRDGHSSRSDGDGCGNELALDWSLLAGRSGLLAVTLDLTASLLPTHARSRSFTCPRSSFPLASHCGGGAIMPIDRSLANSPIYHSPGAAAPAFSYGHVLSP